MEHVEVSQVIEAPVPAVWNRYTDFVSWTDWAGLGKVHLAREGVPPPSGVGCVRVISNLGFAVHEEVLSFEPSERMTYTVIKGGIPIKNHLGEVVFAPHERGTLITWRCRFDSKVPLLGGMFRALVTNVFRNALKGLSRTSF